MRGRPRGPVENELDTDVDTKAHDGHRNENVTPLTLPITEELKGHHGCQQWC